MRRYIVFLLCIALAASSVPATFAAEGTPCGENCYYTFSDGVLTISGEGAMYDFTATHDVPYASYRNLITSVELSDDITSIGKYAFYKCVNLVSINLENVDYVGAYAFYGCSNLDVDDSQMEHGVCAFHLNGNADVAFDMSLSRTEAAFSYLHEVYDHGDDEVQFDIQYCSPYDIECMTNAAKRITEGCETDKEKCDAIYNWVNDHIAYSSRTVSFSAIDVFRNGTAICSGFAQLTSALFKCVGIPSAVCRGHYLNTKTNTLATVYNYSVTHQWTMALIDGEWYLYDAVQNYCGVSDKETIASYYIFVGVDGIYPYSEEGMNVMESFSSMIETYYIGGEFIGYQYGEKVTCSSANLQVGGCLRYQKRYSPYSDSLGYAMSGWSIVSNNLLTQYIMYNGVAAYGVFKSKDDISMYIGTDDVIRLDPQDGMTMVNGMLYIPAGMTLDCSKYYDELGITGTSGNADVISTNGDNVFTAEAVGEATITFRYRTVSVHVYDDATMTYRFKDLMEPLKSEEKDPDLNKDGEINILDLDCLYYYLSENTVYGSLDRDTFLYNANINGDDSINILDYQALYELVKP